VLPLNGAESPDAGTDDDPHAIPGGIVHDTESGVFHRKIGSRQGIMDKGIHLLDILPLDKLLRIEMFDFRGDSGGEMRRIKAGNAPGPGFASQKPLPRLLGPNSQGRDKSDAGYDYAPFHNAALFR
jgi:hypothetical protein